MKDRLCDECEKPIPAARLKELPNTTTCVDCSRVKPLTENDLDLDGPSGEEMRGVMTGNERMGGNGREVTYRKW